MNESGTKWVKCIWWLGAWDVSLKVWGGFGGREPPEKEGGPGVKAPGKNFVWGAKGPEMVGGSVDVRHTRTLKYVFTVILISLGLQ